MARVDVNAMRETWLNQDRSHDDEPEPAIDTRDGSEFEEFEGEENE
jgi:hypothetical protein